MATKSQDKYSKLASTTLIFAISSFSSKVLSFLIRPFVTNVLEDPDIVGVTNLTTQVANVLIPIVSMCIAYAIIRFGLDKANDSKQVFTNGFFTILVGYAVLWLLFPVLLLIPAVSDYIFYLYIYVFTSCLRALCVNFITSEQRNKLVGIDGILCTFATMMFYVLFLVVFKWGAVGYLMAIICADILSALFIFCYAKLWRKFDFKHINLKLWKNMLLFAVPLVPAQISFWVINTSDLFFVQIISDGTNGESGEYWAGLLSTAYFLPLILNTLGAIFYNAWQLSAITEEEGRRKFFAKIFNTYSSLLFCIAAGVIWLCQPLMKVFNEQFFIAWQYVPYLTIAAVFTCLNQFFNSIYVVYKRSMRSFATMFAGAIANCVLNYILILSFGVIGAAAASMIGMALVFVLRAIDTNSLLPLNINKFKMAVNLVLLLVQSGIILLAVPAYWVYTTIITAAVIALNWDGIWMMIVMFVPKFLGARGQKIIDALSGKRGKNK